MAKIVNKIPAVRAEKYVSLGDYFVIHRTADEPDTACIVIGHDDEDIVLINLASGGTFFVPVESRCVDSAITLIEGRFDHVIAVTHIPNEQVLFTIDIKEDHNHE